MRIRAWLVVVGLVAVASVLVVWQAGRAQAPQNDDLFDANKDPWQDSSGENHGNKGERVRVEQREFYNGPWKQKFEIRTGPNAAGEIQAATKELHDAKDEEARDKSQHKLSELLNKYFDEDMKRREEELKKVEARVKNLRAQLQRRREKQRDILDLQMKVLLNEADGLGFFNNETPPGQPGWPVYINGSTLPGVSPATGTMIVAPPAPGGAPGSVSFGNSGSGFSFSTGGPMPPAVPVVAPPVKARPAPRAPRAARPAVPAEAATRRWESNSSSSSDSEAAADEAEEAEAAPSADEAPLKEISVDVESN